MPSGVGAGAASASYKMHALCHSFRLCSPNWKDVVAQLNSIWSWTGDLGTERKFNTYYGNLVELFGDWVKWDDRGAGRDDTGVDELFEFEPVRGELASLDNASVSNVLGDDNPEFDFHRPPSALGNSTANLEERCVPDWPSEDE